ncbi:hypothetical protein DFR49_3350 [Hephaestia caeni]|uniref:Lipoprotein n=1 Tax=Hephaestia caeni TaxID=645617 RepID=A0A397NRX9_9SPHN|nr:hypothetical protein [Hephaestia caeni]RIA37465.1 hypothetical protein DFR49_3350 [Hephaestia caeni]
MRRLAVILVAVILLTACNQRGDDGYAFERQEFNRTHLSVTIVTHPSLADLQRAGGDAGADPGSGRELAAFSTLSATSPACTIHIVDPHVRYEPQWLGHEMAHCIYGRFHR